MKSIIPIVAVFYLFSLYNLELISVQAASSGSAQVPSGSKVDPLVERLCFDTSFPTECLSTVVPNLPKGGNVDAILVLQASLNALIVQADKAIAEAESLKNQAGDDKQLAKNFNTCLGNYKKVRSSADKSMGALINKNFALLESEFNVQTMAVKECEDLFQGAKSEVSDINSSLHILVKNNLSIGNHVMKPTLPHY